MSMSNHVITLSACNNILSMYFDARCVSLNTHCVFLHMVIFDLYILVCSVKSKQNYAYVYRQTIGGYLADIKKTNFRWKSLAYSGGFWDTPCPPSIHTQCTTRAEFRLGFDILSQSFASYFVPLPDM